MKRIVFAWELGKSTGHVSQLLSLAGEFARRAWEVVFLLRNPAALTSLLPDYPHRLLQAPYAPTAPLAADDARALARPLLYSDDLLANGYRDAGSLAALLRQWRDHFQRVEPTVMVCQSAPTALLAAMDLPILRVNLGRGYDVPPLATPMPTLRYWEPVTLAQRQQREDVIMDVINGARRELRLPLLENFASVLDADLSLRCDFPELSHYPPDPQNVEPDHLGPFLELEQGDAIGWQPGFRHRILAHMQPYMAAAPHCLLGLQGLPTDIDIIFVCPGLPANIPARGARPNLRVFDRPVQFRPLLPACDLVLGYASAGVCHALALHGVPTLMFPAHIEQNMMARAVIRTGMGSVMSGTVDGGMIRERVLRMLAQPAYRRAARALAHRHAGHDPARLAERIADRIELRLKEELRR